MIKENRNTSCRPSEPAVPRLWLSFLRWFCPANLREGIEGDLIEQFERDCQAVGVSRARSRFGVNVMRFFRPSILLRNDFSTARMPMGMFLNFFKVARRNMVRNAAYASINVIGLTLGISVAIVLFWIIRFEYNFDRLHRNADRVYQIISKDKFNEPNSHVPQGVIYALRKEFSTVETAATVYGQIPQVLRVEDRNVKGELTFFVHPEFLDMIDVTWLSGSPDRSLSEPYHTVLSRETAERLFGTEDPVGKTIRYDNTIDLVVSGVIEQMPLNSEFQFSMIASYETLTKLQTGFANEDYWGGGDSWCHGFVLLRPGADVSSIESQLRAMTEKRKDAARYVSFELAPLTEAHFHRYNDSFNYSIPLWMLRALSGIALFIVLIAIINYVNLATAQAAYRGREIGLRKTLGSNRRAVVAQFLVETGVMVFLSVASAALLATYLISLAGEFFNTQAHLTQVWTVDMFLYLGGLIVVVTTLAGAYPALILSGIEPSRIFRDKSMVLGSKGVSLRKSLVVVQFVIAQVMVIAMLVGREQMKFFYQTEPGFDRDGILTVNMPFKDSLLIQERFREQLLRHPEITSMTYGLTSPSSDRNWWWGDMHHPRLMNGEQTFRLQWIDPYYLDFYHIKLVAGRNFSQGDSSGYALINEKAVYDMGFSDPSQALGEKMKFWGNNEVTVMGVVSDYYSQGLKSEIPPHLYLNGNWNFQLAQIKVDLRNTAAAVEAVRKSWQELHPDNYFEYGFLSEELKKFYEDERKFSNFILFFSVLAVTIGCLGLVGLVSFVCVRRSKEMSIRKVLGASLSGIIVLLSREFFLLVMVAFLIAAPVGWFLMSRFLQRYTYHTDIEWSVFGVAGLSTVLISVLMVILRSLSTANENPVERLKCE